jgi:hypothetical protein
MLLGPAVALNPQWLSVLNETYSVLSATFLLTIVWLGMEVDQAALNGARVLVAGRVTFVALAILAFVLPISVISEHFRAATP